MDLNLIIYDRKFDNENNILKLIGNAYELGFKTIALSVLIDGNQIQKIPVPPRIKTIHSDLKILKRLTIRIDDGNSLFHLNKSETIKQYDLLALEPINERMLNYLNAGRIDFDILTFNQSDSSLFNSIKKANFSLPISKGIAIELNYGHCLVNSTQRRQTLAFGQILVDKTLGKNIILSSGTKSHLKIRSPRDVIYLGMLFGLEESKCKKILYSNSKDVISHSELRRNLISSIMDMTTKENDDAVLNILKKRKFPKETRMETSYEQSKKLKVG